VAFLFRIVPRFGPFRPLAFKPPTADTERWFLDSFEKTVEYYRTLVDDASRSRLSIANAISTPERRSSQEVSLVDETYARLVERLAKQSGATAGIPAPLLAQIQAFYSDPSAPIETKRHRKEWARLTRDLEKLKAVH
jgi:hypothetical protein